jgi:hypothetical protein
MQSMCQRGRWRPVNRPPHPKPLGVDTGRSAVVRWSFPSDAWKFRVAGEPLPCDETHIGPARRRCRRVGQGATWCHLVPPRCHEMAPYIKILVAPFGWLRRLDLGKLVAVKCHKVPHGATWCHDHSPPPGGTLAPPHWARICADAPAICAFVADARRLRLMFKCLRQANPPCRHYQTSVY